MEPVFGGKLAGDKRVQLRAHASGPHESWGRVGEPVNGSCLVEKGLTPRRVVLRVYLAAAGLMGGYARRTARVLICSTRRWCPCSAEVAARIPGPFEPARSAFTLQRPRDQPVELNRGETSDLPSRAADHLFWLGGYTERGEHLARVLRCILIDTGESGAPEPLEWESLRKLRLFAASGHPAHGGRGARTS
jgi:hypothetical protein